MSKIVRAGILCILLIAVTSFVPITYADVPPPIEYVQTDTGGLFCIASNVSMPEVIVNVTIHLTDTWNYDINVSCAFTITSLLEQNLTTAFVYPSMWTHFSPEQNISVHSFDICVNDSTTEFALLPFDEFKSKYNLNQTDWYLVSDCEFALFNFSINSENPIVVDVFASFSSFSTGHEFIFEYVVDTARRWEGDTHEIIGLQFDRDDETEIIEYGFWPESNYVLTGGNYSALLTWDFLIHDFEYDRVNFVVQQREYPVYRHVYPPNPYYLELAILSVLVLVFIGSILVIKRLGHH